MTKSLGVVSMASWCGSHAWPTWYTSVEKGPPSSTRGRQRALPAFQWDLWWWLPLKKSLWCIDWVSTQWGGLKPGWISGSSWRQWLAEFLSDQYWVQSVQPLDDGAECNLSKFAGDTKLGGVAVTVDGNAAIQNDLKWVNRNVMRFNKENCKVLHLGRSIPMHQCVMVASSVERSLAEKDLEVLVDSRFNMRLSVSKKISLQIPFRYLLYIPQFYKVGVNWPEGHHSVTNPR